MEGYSGASAGCQGGMPEDFLKNLAKDLAGTITGDSPLGTCATLSIPDRKKDNWSNT